MSIRYTRSSDKLHSLFFRSLQRDATGLAVLYEKAYTVITTLDGVHWLFATPDSFDLYTDHNEVIFIFDPLAVVPDMS